MTKLDYHEVLVPNETPYKSFQEHINRYAFAANFVHDKLVLEYARVNYFYGDNIAFLQLDATNLPFRDECFDVVVSLETIEHLQNYGKFLDECRRVLKTSGKFVCSTPNKRIFSPHGGVATPVHVHEFYLGEFYSLLKEYFANIAIYGQRFVPITGIIMLELYYHGLKLLDTVPGGDKIKKFIERLITHFRHPPIDPIAKLGFEIRPEILDKKHSVRPYRKSIFSTPGCITIVAGKA